MNKTTLCLCMIVKNESHIILDTLESIKDYVDYWVICDTGSTDNTPELIQDFFDKAGIKGDLHRVEWKNFGFNRTQVFELAYKKADYLWVIDADDFLVGTLDFGDLTADAYRLKYVLGGITYYRDQLFKGDLQWEYKGVLHEYPFCLSKENHNFAAINGDYYIHARTAGARSKIEPTAKYLVDAKTMELALDVEQDEGLIRRYLFYIAQSYRDAEEHELAIQWYQRRVGASGWVEEVWYSKYQIARLYETLGYYPKALLAYLDAFEYRPTRAEALYSLGKLCNIRSEYFQAYLFLDRASKTPMTQDILFVSNSVYDYEIIFELSISTYWMGKYQESIDLCNRLITMKDQIHPNVYEQTLKNKEFSVAKNSHTTQNLYGSRHVENYDLPMNSGINQNKPLVRLNVGCGRNTKAGWVNLDSIALPGVDLVCDLEKLRETPIDLPNESVECFLLSHVIEHIQDSLGLMQELWRIAIPGAHAVIHVPHGASDDAWEDPTHVRAYFLGSFGYFSQPYYWRADYGYRADWQPNKIQLMVNRVRCTGLSVQEILEKAHNERNVVIEMICEMTAIKPIRQSSRELQTQPHIEIVFVD
jgi:glycosyltransferase involved in cell wall biosynthesis/SAM-dependent methyltransferase